MKKILFISATSNTNLTLSKQLSRFVDNSLNKIKIINLEEFNLPIYNPSTFSKDKTNNINNIKKLTDIMVSSDAYIICAPEYNGSIPPVLTNIISWLSVMGGDWRLVFNGKVGLLATHSGGGGNNLLQSLRIQLNHLGTLVLPRSIIVNSKIKFDINSAKEKVKQLIELL